MRSQGRAIHLPLPVTEPIGLYRMIDANANRVREALRVLEDIARFAFDDGPLSRELKEFRHEFQGSLTGLDSARLLAARDTSGDVGTKIATDREMVRADTRAIAGAACGRLTEAMRSLEEAAKGVGAPDVSVRIESLRYRAYELERRVMLALPAGKGRQWGLCVLLTESLCTHLPWLEVACQAAAAGAACIQLREPELGDRELLSRAERLREALPRACDLIVNNRPDIAVLSGAQGVHLGQTDTPLERVREVVGSLLVGASTSCMEEARRAALGGADYCGVGPMFATATKRKDRIAGPEYLREYLREPATASRPHLAIGGINLETIGELVQAGCRGIAVSSAVCGARKPGDVCRALMESLNSVTEGRPPARIP